MLHPRETIPPAWRVPIVVGSIVRLVYGTGAAIAPSIMSRRRLAPRIYDMPDPRMNLRGFGGALSAIALYTLASARSPERARSLLWLNALTDVCDTAVSLLELRARGKLDRVVAGGLGINLTALAWWTLATRTLQGAH
jgi:hypothetical protein